MDNLVNWVKCCLLIRANLRFTASYHSRIKAESKKPGFSKTLKFPVLLTSAFCRLLSNGLE